VGVTDTSAVVNIDLATADVTDGRIIVVKDFSGGATAMNITVSTQAGELIDGAASQPIAANYGSLTLVCNGTNWYII
jgi:hypothetical protein